eukprot:TRINITY_DN13674_c0_g1_i1.p1 TRINITY_DN13674_c0_g1~~TRINITY_DN13674_c0_g1_i1.p1  ORF type:complete len:484 (+),score=60.24 TRINITY_DN13674_c0_g1_i1:190-1452(+)
MVIWDSPFIEDDVDAFSSAYTVNGGEETLASSSASTFDEASTHVLSIKPPVFAKPASRRPWVGVSCSLKQAADVAGSQSHATAARLSDEQDTAISPPSTADASSAHDIDVEDSVEAKPRQHSRQAWALDGSARSSSPPEMWSTRRVNKEQDTLEPEEGQGRADVRLESAEEKLKSNFSKLDGALGRTRSTSKPRAQSDHRKRRVKASRSLSESDGTSLSREETTYSCDVQRRLHSNGFGPLPSCPPMNAARPVQRLFSDVPQLEQAGSSRRSESAMRPKMASSRPKLEPPSPRMVIVSTDAAKGSAVKYNHVQFTATPSLSTSCDKNHTLTPRANYTLTPRAPKAKSAAIGQTTTHEGLLDAQSATDVVLHVFRGWSKRDVKEMLQGKYSSEEIAEVLELLGEKEPRKTKRSHSTKASGA